MGAGARQDGGILILGIGNPLRSDDAFGWAVAERLEADPPDGARILALHALGPEIAEPIAGARLVIFVDAAIGESPGRTSIRRLRARPSGPSFGHAWDPERLLGLAREVYGRAPRAVLVALGARSFELGGAPDPCAVERAVAIVREIADGAGDDGAQIRRQPSPGAP